jgi:hypothetical protein
MLRRKKSNRKKNIRKKRVVSTKNEVVLLDRQGRVRLQLSLEGNDEEPRLTFFDKNGIDCFMIGINEDKCSWLCFNDEKNKHQMGVGLSATSGPMLLMSNKGLFPAIMLNANNSYSTLILTDNKGSGVSIFDNGELEVSTQKSNNLDQNKPKK